MKTVIAVSTHFSAAHRLPDHEGMCCRLHGHTYSLEVAVSGDPQTSGPASGMVMDYADLRSQVKAVITDRLDHTMLNDIVDFVPTVEAIAAWAFGQLRQAGVPVVRVRLSEGPDTYVEITDRLEVAD
jgi:6-pyruvoyltetrahydropterin/6-carboxytetrahydropterin synthase